MKNSIIFNSGIVNGFSNGERHQTIIYTNDKNEKFKIAIGTFVSNWAALLKWSDANGWCLIIQKHIKRDYKIDINYQDKYAPTAFSDIYNELTELSSNF